MKRNFTFYLVSAGQVLAILPLIPLSYVFPRSKSRIVIGAWFSNLYADNPKYFLLYLLKSSNIKVTWIGSSAIEHQLPCHPNLSFARKGSLKATWALLRSKTWIFCTSLVDDLTGLPLRGNAICINLWHGAPLKFVGRRTPLHKNDAGDSLLGQLYSSFMHAGRKWAYTTLSSEEMGRMLAEGIPTLFNPTKFLSFGTPRNDYLIRNATNDALKQTLKQKYENILGLPMGKTIILYLPTHRKEGAHTFAFYELRVSEQEYIKKLLDMHNAILIEKHHYWTLKNYPITAPSICSIPISAKQQNDVDVQELLLISDILICDYTSAYLDFTLLKRPILHFAYDYAEYKAHDAGMAFPLEEYAGGPICDTLTNLLKQLNQTLVHPIFTPAEKCHELTTYETGHSCEQTLRFIHGA